MAQQIGLFGPAQRVFVDDETGLIAYYPQVFALAESARLFAELQSTLPWASETMWMYDHTVNVPRLVVRYAPGDPLPPELAHVRERVEAHLHATFTSMSAQYYRDGNDSVAWHSDHNEGLIERPIVALLSLGAVREIQVRGKARPRRAFSCDLEPGSLFVMSGRAQEFWEHHVPKVKRAVGPRISIALRQRRID